ncbi:MAG: PilZ domain-containing protein [Planctomycetales bacterium]|nr:PilZ domain-containing protein [Planctomycetales bacterium]
MSTAVDQLLKENQASLLHERRAVPRTAFTRPVTISSGRREMVRGFSRDISNQGIGIIDQYEWAPGSIAEIEIHSLFGCNVRVRAEARWCESFGDGWYTTGWHFLDA